MAAEQINETPNLLIQLGEALGPFGSLLFLLLLSGGTVWVVMSVRINREDHQRLERGIESLREETREDSRRIREDLQAWRKESREDSRETKGRLRSIDTRLDQIVDRKPPSQPG